MRSVEALEEDVALCGNVCAGQAQKKAARLKNASPCAPEKRDQPEIIKVLGKRMGVRGKGKSPFIKGGSSSPASSLPLFPFHFPKGAARLKNVSPCAPEKRESSLK